MSEPLRPLSLGDVLDRTASLYRRNFWLLTGTAAIPMGAMIGIFVALGLVGVGIGAWAGFSHVGASSALGVVVFLAILVMMPLLLAITVYSNASLSFAAACLHLDRKPTIKESLKSVTPRFWRYFWLLILQGIFISIIPMAIGIVVVVAILGIDQLMGGGAPGPFPIFLVVLAAIATFVAAVLQALKYLMAFPVCVIEGQPAWQSLRRAGQLSKGTRGRIFIMFLLVWLLSMMLSMVVYIPVVILMGIAAAVFREGAAMVATLVVA